MAPFVGLCTNGFATRGEIITCGAGVVRTDDIFVTSLGKIDLATHIPPNGNIVAVSATTGSRILNDGDVTRIRMEVCCAAHSFTIGNRTGAQVVLCGGILRTTGTVPSTVEFDLDKGRVCIATLDAGHGAQLRASCLAVIAETGGTGRIVTGTLCLENTQFGNAPGTFILDGPNLASGLRARATALTFTNVQDYRVFGIFVNGNVTLNTDGTASQGTAGTVTVKNLTLNSVTCGKGAYILDRTGNNGSSENTVCFLSAGASKKVASLTFITKNGFTETGINSAGPVRLSASCCVPGPGAIRATALFLDSSCVPCGNFTLTNPANSISTLTANLTKLVDFRSSSGFTVTGFGNASAAKSGSIVLRSNGVVNQSGGIICASSITVGGVSAGCGIFNLCSTNRVDTIGTCTRVASLNFKNGAALDVLQTCARTSVQLTTTAGSLTNRTHAVIAAPTVGLAAATDAGACGSPILVANGACTVNLTANASSGSVFVKSCAPGGITIAGNGSAPTCFALAAAAGPIGSAPGQTIGAATVSLMANGGITAHTRATTVCASATAPGCVVIDNATSGLVTFRAASACGNVTLSNAGDLKIAAPTSVAPTRNICISTTCGGTIQVCGDLSAAGGSATLSAAGGITAAGRTITASTVNLIAGTDIGSAGKMVTLGASGSTLDATAGGGIFVRDPGALAARAVHAGGALQLTAGTDLSRAAGGTLSGNSVLLCAGGAVALAGVAGTGAVQITSGGVANVSNVSGAGVTLSSGGALTALGVTSSADANLSAGGSLSASAVTAANNLRLVARGGDLIALADTATSGSLAAVSTGSITGQVTSGGPAQLRAGTTIGRGTAACTAMNVAIAGPLTVCAAGVCGGISVNLVGTVGGGRPAIGSGSLSGLGLFNGALFFPDVTQGNGSVALANIGNVSAATRVTDAAQFTLASDLIDSAAASAGEDDTEPGTSPPGAGASPDAADLRGLPESQQLDRLQRDVDRMSAELTGFAISGNVPAAEASRAAALNADARQLMQLALDDQRAGRRRLAIGSLVAARAKLRQASKIVRGAARTDVRR